jgi:ubiquinone biosynthesis monooxygenase Coq7
MEPRVFGIIDRALGTIDNAIKVLAVPARSSRATPALSGASPALEPAERLESIRLMRVNHSGEIAAQALYQGQALTARTPEVAEAMRRAAAEEADHLAWCEQRLRELNGHSSLLNPLWYAGSFVIGALAGAIGDAVSLGFVAETERQVEAHLSDHGERLAAADSRSRAILEQMRQEEIAHGARAGSLGAKQLPFALKQAMRWSSKLMTGSSYWL